MKPFLILETGRPVASLRRHGSFGHWIRIAAGLPRAQARSCFVMDGEPLPRASDHAGVLVTGSGAMVTDREPWSERTGAWLRDAAEAELPLFGICYGHQLLAQALGGEIAWNPRGREMGTVPVRLHAAAREDALFAGLSRQIHAQATHSQTVLRPPAGAVVLGESDQDGCQAFRWGESAWGVQFHPEFSAGMMRGYIHARREALRGEGTCPAQLDRAVRPTPQARRVLQRFIRFARMRDATHQGPSQ